MTPGTEQVGKMEKNSHLSASKEAIHSGHFMVSDIDDSEVPDEDNVSVPVLEAEDRSEVTVSQCGFDFESACKETSNTYTFGPRSCKSISIDATLTKLFQCMTIAYSGKLTSPRWKNFKGLKLRWKDKIRLNNVIWRAWHMQFINRQSPVVCQFASPIDGDTHNRPEAVVLEGKYWKRRLETVCAEYKKWRLFYKERLWQVNRALSDSGLDFDVFNWQPRSNQSYHSPSSMIIDDDPFTDFNDTLFSCLIPNQPFAFPNPREMARAGIADFIQPGLVQFQPNLDDFADTLDFLACRLPAVTEERDDSFFQGWFNMAPQTPSPSIRGAFDVSVASESNNQEPIQQFPVNKSFTQPNISPFTLDESDFPLMDTSVLSAELDAPSQPPPLQSPPLPEKNCKTNSLLVSISEEPQQQCSLSMGMQRQAELRMQRQADLGMQRQTDMGSQRQTGMPHRKSSAPGKMMSNSASLLVSPETSPPQQQTASSKNIFSQPSRIRSKPPSTSTGAQKSGSKLPVLHPGTRNSTGATKRQQQTQQSNSGQLRSSVSAPSSLLQSSSTIQRTSDSSLLTTKQDVFIVPKGVPRTRARSASGPQISTGSNNVLTTGISTAVAPIYPQNVLIAQLLTSGNTYIHSGDKLMADSQPPVTQVNNLTGNMTIISQATNPQQQPATMVISPIQLEQRNNLSPHSPPALTISSTDSSFTSTMSGHMSTLNSGELTRQAAVKPYRPKSDSERVQYREHRRVCHINAEQKRRCNIKTGFDLLNTLVPSLMQNPPNKLSKAVVLQKAGEYIVQLRSERAQLQEEADMLRKQIESLNQAISVCQASLPATGAPVSRQRIGKLRDMFDEYVRKRTLQNWKFWIFSILIQPLLESYNNSVSTASIADFSRTVLTWLEQHCSLLALRPAVLNSLRHLSTTTNILSDPTRIAEEATQAVTKSMQCEQ